MYEVYVLHILDLVSLRSSEGLEYLDGFDNDDLLITIPNGNEDQLASKILDLKWKCLLIGMNSDIARITHTRLKS